MRVGPQARTENCPNLGDRPGCLFTCSLELQLEAGPTSQPHSSGTCSTEHHIPWVHSCPQILGLQHACLLGCSPHPSGPQFPFLRSPQPPFFSGSSPATAAPPPRRSLCFSGVYRSSSRLSVHSASSSLASSPSLPPCSPLLLPAHNPPSSSPVPPHHPGSHLTAFGHGEAASQEKDDVPGHCLLGFLPAQQGLGL